MFEAMLSAASGLMGQQRRIDTIADNLANVNTAAFNSSRLNFQDLLYVEGHYPYRETAQNQQKGHGVLTASISRNFAVGSLSETERELDFAIEGEGFFMAMATEGDICFTRQGNFYLSEVGDEWYVVDSRGHFILDDDESPIILPAEASGLNVNAAGEINFYGPDGFMAPGGLIGIRSFVNPEGLKVRGLSYYEPTVASGEAQSTNRYKLRQGVLEMSNVDLATEMTRMIRTQRAFSLASRALTTADDMEGIANNMKR
ncbi:MAG: flagellar hook-basal body protein [Firmicutes bacterium]|nr:flagellar hook-basal body protein [Bacillota bacterium]